MRAAVFDQFEGGADDAALLLYGAAGALFGDFLEEKGVLEIGTHREELGGRGGGRRIVRGRALDAMLVVILSSLGV